MFSSAVGDGGSSVESEWSSGTQPRLENSILCKLSIPAMWHLYLSDGVHAMCIGSSAYSISPLSLVLLHSPLYPAIGQATKFPRCVLAKSGVVVVAEALFPPGPASTEPSSLVNLP